MFTSLLKASAANFSPASTRVSKTDNDSSPALSVLLVYDELEARHCAMEIFNLLTRTFGHQIDIQPRWLSFDELIQCAPTCAAVQLAAQADVIVLATVNATMPAAPVQNWLEQVAAEKPNRERALVAVVGQENLSERSQTMVHRQLAEIAQNGQMAYFWGLFEIPRILPDYSVDSIVARAETVSPLLREILGRPCTSPRWGINE